MTSRAETGARLTHVWLVAMGASCALVVNFVVSASGTVLSDEGLCQISDRVFERAVYPKAEHVSACLVGSLVYSKVHVGADGRAIRVVIAHWMDWVGFIYYGRSPWGF